jgi:hypothetical protein
MLKSCASQNVLSIEADKIQKSDAEHTQSWSILLD